MALSGVGRALESHAAAKLVRQTRQGNLEAAFLNQTPKVTKPMRTRSTVNTNREAGSIQKLQGIRSGARKLQGSGQYPNTLPSPGGKIKKTVYSQADREKILADKAANKAKGQARAAEIGGYRKEAARRTAAENAAKNHPLQQQRHIPDHDMRQRELEAAFNPKSAKGKAAVDDYLAGKSTGTSRASIKGSKVSDPTISGQVKTDPKIGGKINLAAGGAATENMTQQITQTANMMGRNWSDHVAANGGAAKFLGKSALQGAVWGGAVGGTMSAAQGGDFWAGAKEGAFKGAVGMAGYNSLKAGVKAKSFGDISHNTQQMWNHHSVSKPVQAITRTAPTMNVANQMVNNGK